MNYFSNTFCFFSCCRVHSLIRKDLFFDFLLNQTRSFSKIYIEKKKPHYREHPKSQINTDLLLEGKRLPMKSRIYGNKAIDHPSKSDYYDYLNFCFDVSHHHKYQLIKRLGTGVYSDVYECIEKHSSQKVILKILKPINERRLKREITILERIKGVPYVLQLIDIIKHPSGIYGLVYPFYDNIKHNISFPFFTNLDLSIYIFQLLTALNGVHQKGIIHRDIKPSNIMWDNKNYSIALVDWGLAEFYLPGELLSVRVASRNYKAPELLVDQREYDYMLDMWGVGCILAGIIFQKEPFFRSKGNYEMLTSIAQILGSDDLKEYLNKYQLQLDPRLVPLIEEEHYPRKDWQTLMKEIGHSFPLASPLTLDLLDKILCYDPQKRLTAIEALHHPFFDSIRQTNIEKLIYSQKNGCL